MSLDFRDGKSFPRRGRERLGEFLWLARVFDKARAKKHGTQDGYIYPCPMDRGVLRRWGVTPRDFTEAITENTEDAQILAWISTRVTPDRTQSANAWLLRQTYSLDRQDVQEGVPGATAPLLPWHEIGIGAAIAAVGTLLAWLILR